MKILIIRFSAIGDIVWTSLLIRCLKTQIPKAELHFVTKAQFGSLVQANPHLHKVWLLDSSLTSLITALQNEHFDYVLDVHNNLRSRYITFKLGVPYQRLRKYYVLEWLYVFFKLNRMPKLHVAERMLATAHDLGITNDGLGISFYLDPQQKVDTKKQFGLPAGSYTVCIAGASRATKRLNAHKLAQLLTAIEGNIVIVGGSSDSAYVQQALAILGQPERIWNVCGALTLPQSASVVQQARKVVGHDTGLTHIASAFHKHLYSIWGNTTPAFGMYPYGVQNTYLEVLGLSCRPCSKIGYQQCPKGHHKCINDLDFSPLKNSE